VENALVNWNAECDAVQPRRRNRTFLLFARGISARNSVAPRRDNGVSPDLQQPPSVTIIADTGIADTGIADTGIADTGQRRAGSCATERILSLKWAFSWADDKRPDD
jgi:hypothetical protein